MRRTTILAILLVGIGSWAHCEDAGQADTVLAYTKALDALDPAQAQSIPMAVGRYLVEFPQRPPAERDAASVAFLRFYSQCTKSVGDSIRQALTKVEPDGTWDAIEQHPDFTFALSRCGLHLVPDAEGYWLIMAKPGFVQRIFGPHVSEPLQRYMELREPEMQGIWMGDGGLAICHKELADRVGRWTEYIERYPKSPFKANAKRTLSDYLFWFFIGSSNTHVFDFADSKHQVLAANQEYLDAYRYYIGKYPKTPIAELTREFLSLLESNERKRAPEVVAHEQVLKTYITSLFDATALTGSAWTQDLYLPPVQESPTQASPAASPADNAKPEYFKYLSQQDKSDPASLTKAVGQYLIEMTGQPTWQRDQTFRTLLRFHDACMLEVAKRLREQSKKLALSNAQQPTEIFKHPELTADLGRYGLEILSDDTGWVVVPRRSFLLDNLTGHVSEGAQSYIENRDAELGVLYLRNGTLGISPQELADRLARWDSLLGNHSRCIMSDAATTLRTTYLRLFLFGAEKMPVLGADCKVKPDFVAAYEYFVRRYPRVKAAEPLREYLARLKKANLVLTPELAQFRDNIQPLLDPYGKSAQSAPRLFLGYLATETQSPAN